MEANKNEVISGFNFFLSFMINHSPCHNLTMWMQLHNIVQQHRSSGSASGKRREATIQTRRERT